MTTYTRPSRIARRDDYLVRKFRGNPRGLIQELSLHQVKASFNPLEASHEELTAKFKLIRECSSQVIQKFPREYHGYFPSLEGIPVAFIPQSGGRFEIVLRRQLGAGSFYPHRKPEEVRWEYRSVFLPQELFLGDVGKITKYTRGVLRAGFQETRRKEEAAAEAARIKLVDERKQLDRSILEAERKLQQLKARKVKLGAS